MSVLAPALVEDVLARLELDAAPTPDREGLASLYAAWGERVPWDSLRKRIYFAEGGTGPLPGLKADDFFTAWLTHGTGGTCFSGTAAMHALLTAIGFRVRLGAGNVLADPGDPVPPVPNHATNIVDFDDDRPPVIVDTSFLTHEPLPVVDDDETTAGGPARRVDSSVVDGTRWLRFRPVLVDRMIPCRIRTVDATTEELEAWHDETRKGSLFNNTLVSRRNVGDGVVGWSWNQRVDIDGDGTYRIEAADRTRVLVDELGYTEEIVARLPDDEAL